MPFKTTEQRYYIVREDLAGKDLVNKRVKVELTEDWIQTLANLTRTRLPNELHDSLRKVLE